MSDLWFFAWFYLCSDFVVVVSDTAVVGIVVVAIVVVGSGDVIK